MLYFISIVIFGVVFALFMSKAGFSWCQVLIGSLSYTVPTCRFEKEVFKNLGKGWFERPDSKALFSTYEQCSHTYREIGSESFRSLYRDGWVALNYGMFRDDFNYVI